jgi:hypothetical protein
MNNLEFIIYKTILAYNNQNVNPNRMQIERAINKQYPKLHYATESINTTTRFMVEHEKIKEQGSGFMVPITMPTSRIKQMEQHRFLAEFIR